MNLLTISVILYVGGNVWAVGSRSSSQCGVPLSLGKIIGGVDSGGYRYPWFALLLLKKNSFLPVPICGGSLITSFHVLTAAHCFTISGTIKYDDLFSIAFEVYDLCNSDQEKREIFDVAGVAVHEKYQKREKFYDIAVIKLNRPAGFTPICLPLSGVPDITEMALLIGFGVTNANSNSIPCHMMEVNVTKYSKSDCMRSKLPLEDKTEPSVICAGGLKGDVDSCYGDSGGPLQTQTTDGRYVISGIVSYGYGCATPNLPGVYTNVGSYLHWINDKISSLGSKESNISANRSKQFHLFNPTREIFRGSKSSVTFPKQGTTSHSTDGEPQVTEHRLHKDTPIFKTVFSSRENNSSGNVKTSKVSFPE